MKRRAQSSEQLDEGLLFGGGACEGSALDEIDEDFAQVQFSGRLCRTAPEDGLLFAVTRDARPGREPPSLLLGDGASEGDDSPHGGDASGDEDDHHLRRFRSLNLYDGPPRGPMKAPAAPGGPGGASPSPSSAAFAEGWLSLPHPLPSSLSKWRSHPVNIRPSRGRASRSPAEGDEADEPFVPPHLISSGGGSRADGTPSGLTGYPRNREAFMTRKRVLKATGFLQDLPEPEDLLPGGPVFAEGVASPLARVQRGRGASGRGRS